MGLGLVGQQRLRRRELGLGVVGLGVVGLGFVGLGQLGQRNVGAVSAVAATAPARPRLLPLAPPAAALYFVVVGAAVAAAIAAALTGDTKATDWIALCVLAAAAAVAQLFIVRTGNNQGFHTALVFVTAGALVLPPALVVLLAVVQHVPEWIKERYPAYIQTFNAANFALNGLAGWAIAHALADVTQIDPYELRWTIAGFAAAVGVVFANHALLAWMLRLARGCKLRDSGLFTTEALGLDAVLGLLGVTVAFCWIENPWLLPALFAPLVAAHRAFRMLGLLRESEHRFRAMFEAAPFGVLLYELDGKLLESNAALEEMLGYSADEFLVLPPDVYFRPDDLALDAELFAELVAGERTGYDLDCRLTAKDGRAVLARAAAAVIRDADGRPKYRLSLVEDVTRRAELEDQLRQAQRLEAIGRLAGGIAHDFNNLLTAISGYADVALGRLGPADERLRSDVQEIRKAGDRAAALTAQLLAFSRKQVLQPREVSLNDLVADMQSLLQRLIGEHLSLSTVFYGPARPRVHADPGGLDQIVVNLVVNARDAMPRGGEITLETRCVELEPGSPVLSDGAQPGEYAVLSVRDTGVGISAQDVGQVFEPFFTTKEVGKGTGLGLATVHGVVAQSGGFITVESESGRGTTFSVYLPQLVTEPAEVGAPAPEAARDTGNGQETILLVEDEEVVRRLAREMLELSGYSVLEAEDGAAALDRADAVGGAIDLLVTDVVMPGMTGPELAERLRELHGGTRVLFTSGYADTALTGDGVLDERTQFLQKPFGITTLTQKVRAVLDAA
jgi:PAS domain S-box-containing protein